MEDFKTTGQRLREAREKLGMSVVDLEQKAMISGSFIRDVEKDKWTIPGVWAMKRLAKAVNVPLEYLVDKEGYAYRDDTSFIQ